MCLTYRNQKRGHTYCQIKIFKEFLIVSSTSFHLLATTGWKCPLSLLLLYLSEGRRKRFEVLKSQCTHLEDSSVGGQVTLTLCPGFPALSNGHNLYPWPWKEQPWEEKTDPVSVVEGEVTFEAHIVSPKETRYGIGTYYKHLKCFCMKAIFLLFVNYTLC